jgi:hypothetical protein
LIEDGVEREKKLIKKRCGIAYLSLFKLSLRQALLGQRSRDGIELLLNASRGVEEGGANFFDGLCFNFIVLRMFFTTCMLHTIKVYKWLIALAARSYKDVPVRAGFE